MVDGTHACPVPGCAVKVIQMLALAAVALAAPARAAKPRVAVLVLRDTIHPVSLRYVERGLREAAQDRAELVVIELDTPGGLLVSLRAMTSAVLASPVPVAVYVTPSGARAASAGFFLLLAADVAAMAPGTNAGAAHPVLLGSGQRDEQTASAGKAAQDAAALARSLAAGRHRSAEWAERAVLESASYSAEEAKQHGLVDIIATDRNALLGKLDGASIRRFDGATTTLHLRDADVRVVHRTIAERVLGAIADPQIAYLLLMGGAIGLLIELTSPGLIVPGVAGAVSLLLGLYGMSVLPVTLAGGLMIAAGLALLVAEVFVTSYGLLAIAGIASFVIGSLMLVDASVPEFAIGPGVVAPVAIVLAGFTALLAVRAVRVRRLRSQTGLEAMIGEPADVVENITPDHDGRVFVHGEYWTATATSAVAAGTRTRIVDVAGLRLRVTPEPQGGSS